MVLGDNEDKTVVATLLKGCMIFQYVVLSMEKLKIHHTCTAREMQADLSHQTCKFPVYVCIHGSSMLL